jgi:hypothetical protein
MRQRRQIEKIPRKQRLRSLSGILQHIQKICGITLTKYQLDAATTIFRAHLSTENSEVDMLWARRSGKTECLAFAGITIGIYELIVNESTFLLGLVNPAKTNQSVMVTRKRMQQRLEQLKAFLLDLGITMTLGKGQKPEKSTYTANPTTHDSTYAPSPPTHQPTKKAKDSTSFSWNRSKTWTKPQ